MNRLQGVISEIDTFENLSLVTVRVGTDTFSSLLINSPETDAFCRTGSAVRLAFKETEVSIGKGLTGGLSLRNRFPARITAIETGRILTSLTLQYGNFSIQSVITSRSAQELALRIGDQVEGLVKTNEMMLEKQS